MQIDAIDQRWFKFGSHQLTSDLKRCKLFENAYKWPNRAQSISMDLFERALRILKAVNVSVYHTDARRASAFVVGSLWGFMHSILFLL